MWMCLCIYTHQLCNVHPKVVIHLRVYVWRVWCVCMRDTCACVIRVRTYVCVYACVGCAHQRVNVYTCTRAREIAEKVLEGKWPARFDIYARQTLDNYRRSFYRSRHWSMELDRSNNGNYWKKFSFHRNTKFIYSILFHCHIHYYIIILYVYVRV